MKYKALTTLAAAVLLVSCGQTGSKAPQTRPFRQAQVPALVTAPEDAAKYLSAHWWDCLVDTTGTYATDSLNIVGIPRAEVEQAMANYASFLEGVSIPVMRKSVGAFCDKLEAMEGHSPADSTFETMVRMFDRYLYDPNSPMRNEEIYLPFCERMSCCEFMSAEKRDIYAHHASMCSLNRINTPAADFRFSDRYGKMHSLYGIKAPYTLLFFSNPGCHACKDIIDNLTTIPEISSMVAGGRLAVLNIYIDEDLSGWYEYMPIYPDEWYNGYDPNLVIRGDCLYDVRAIPSLYILDEEKRVLMKDVPENKAFDFLYALSKR